MLEHEEEQKKQAEAKKKEEEAARQKVASISVGSQEPSVPGPLLIPTSIRRQRPLSPR